ncbi:MAG TPA: hypothetical protein VGB77_09840, partial [Abditibacteriaceae bacterium]
GSQRLKLRTNSKNNPHNKPMSKPCRRRGVKEENKGKSMIEAQQSFYKSALFKHQLNSFY